LIFIGVFLALSTQTHAKEKEKIGPGIYPAITGAYINDDNVFKTEEDAVGDDIFKVQPSVVLKAIFRKKHTLELSYFADIFRYRINDTENFEDHYVDGALTLEFTKKLKLELAADYASAHETRGASGTRLGISQDPDAWWADRLFAEVTYGRKESKNQLILHGEAYRRRYTNNNQEPRSRDRQILRLTYFHNRKEKTRILLEGEYKTFDYFDKTAPIDLTSDEKSIMLGVSWEATAKTSGTLKAGYLQKDLEDPQIPDYDGWSALLEVTWEPRTYFELRVHTLRATKESPHTIASYYISTELGYELEWEITDRWVFSQDLLYQRDEYESITEAVRNDDLLDVDAELVFRLHRWIDLGARYLYSSRRSTFPDIDYTANVIMISISFDTMKPKEKKT